MEEKSSNKGKEKLAVVRIKGSIRLNRDVTETFKLLRLHKRNFCVVVPNNDNLIGMVKKVKDYVAWGELNDKTFNDLVEKRGEEYTGRETSKNEKIKYNKFFLHDNKKYKKFFRLNSPKKGYGRKGVKEVFSKGGALGYRGSKINDLIERMI